MVILTLLIVLAGELHATFGIETIFGKRRLMVISISKDVAKIMFFDQANGFSKKMAV